MMHHYGRHGPRAWLRRWQRRYWRPPPPTPAREASPALPAVKSQQLANVRVWQLTERIIVIMVGNDLYPEPDNVTLFSAFGQHPLSTSESHEIPSALRSQLNIKLSTLTDEIQEMAGSGDLITIHQERLNRILRRFIKNQLNTLNLPIPTRKAVDEIVESGLAYSSKELEQALTEKALNYRILATEADQQLAAKARADRQRYGPLSASMRHALAVLAALEVRGLRDTSEISEEQLKQLDADASWYEEVFHKGKDIIEWPPEESFRGQHNNDMGY